MIDNTLQINTSESSEDDSAIPKVILLVPEGVEKPIDFPIEVVSWSWDNLVSVIGGDFPIVLESNPEFINLIELASQMNDIELKVVDGFVGQYPSYWLIVTNKYPHVTASEIQLAAENTRELGGTGVPAKKMPKSEFKKLEPEVRDNAQNLSEELWDAELDNEGLQE